MATSYCLKWEVVVVVEKRHAVSFINEQYTLETCALFCVWHDPPFWTPGSENMPDDE